MLFLLNNLNYISLFFNRRIYPFLIINVLFNLLKSFYRQDNYIK